MPQYVLRHGGLSKGLENASAGVPLMPSADPFKPTIVEMEEAEAKRINGNVAGQLLPGVKPKPAALQLKAEYDAELAAAAASVKAKADVLAKARAEKPKDEKPKGGGK